MLLRSSRSHRQPNHAGRGRAHALCARAMGYCSLPCKRGGPRGRPGRVAAWARAHPCALCVHSRGAVGGERAGPHMYWAGIQFRADQKANDQKEREFAQASSRDRAAVAVTVEVLRQHVADAQHLHIL